MADIHEILQAEKQPSNLEDAFEIIAALRAVVDEQIAQIDALEERCRQSSETNRTRRERLVEVTLPVVIQKFTMRSDGLAADHDRLFICSTTIKLVDQMIREMGDEG